MIKSKSNLLASILSFLFPGLGQYYKGWQEKGLLTYAVFVSLLCLLILFGLGTTFWQWVASFCFFMGFRIFSGVKAYSLETAAGQKPFPHWGVVLGAFLVISILISFVITKVSRSTESFKILTYTHKPSIQPHDVIVADVKAYRKEEPNYGDLVIFEDTTLSTYFSESVTSVFRVVGLPHDSIEVLNGVLYINGQAATQRPTGNRDTEDSLLVEFLEELPNGFVHRIYRNETYVQEDMGKVVVPPESYFLLGNNRDLASDSRYFGAISKKLIKGKVKFVLFGADLSRIAVDLSKSEKPR